DEDWFSFQLPNSATYTVETLDVSNRANHPDTVITLYGPDSLSSPLFANDDGGDARLSRITQVLQGDCVYHVRVSGYSGSTGFYRIRLRTVPDNEPLSAIPLTVNAPMTSGVFVGGASEHLYTFRTTVSGIHSIRIFQSSQSGDSPLQIVLYRADDEKNCLSPIFPDSSLTKVLPDNQVYVVKVIPSAQLAGHYRIGVEAGATGSHVYVRADAMPGGDGFSWEKAFNSIGSALEVMWATGEVWAAAGTYSESVEMKPGIAIYGGFTGTEQTREDRDWAGNETVINAGRLFASAVTGADGALLDGFTVTGGQRSGVFCPSGSSPTFSNCILRTNKSFGVHCPGSSPTLINCTISENPGGAIYCSDSRLTLTNCMISENSARQGGGIRCSRSSLTLTNSTVALNSVEVSGGGIYCEDSSAMLTNCIITGNSAEGGGGGIYSTKSFPTLTNCTIARNVAGRGSGLWSESGSLSLTNCILWNPGSEIEGSVVATYSCIQGGWPGQGNISHYPEFVDSTNGDYHLRNGSPCVDTGLVSVAPAEDIEEHNRPGADGLVDMGAYESPAEYESGIGREPLRLAYVCADADPGGDGLSWESAFNSIGAALEMIRVTGEIWVAAGRYSESIGMEPGLTLYGGFSGVEKTQKERDWKRNETIIDAAGLGSVAVTGAQGSSLDGFTVTGGKNGGVRCHESSPKVINCTIHKNPGGGVCCMGEASPMLIHCTIRENSDSGVFCDSGASPIVIDCTITGNSTLYGGGVYCDGGSSPTLTDCTITGNFSSYGGGGVCCQESSSPIFANCTISDNGGSGDRPSRDGGGVYCRRSSPTLTNCIIAGNKARNGGGIYCESGAFPKLINCSFSGNSANNGNALACVPRWPPSEPEFTNCILWDGGNEISIYENPTITVSYSNIQGGWSGEGNIDRDPLFVRPWDGEGADLHLMPDSPCIDAGNPDSSYNDASLPPGLCRERGDMGAYGGPQNSGWPEEPGLPVGISEWTLY
ncbi:MAG TPA: right-handed parallel beta-helix repeat-containing protein, partial [bacterium]|nr:right-handed parallel beta-helix repeat-containing protein [bacterium]